MIAVKQALTFAEIARATKGMKPKEKARWIWDNTNIRPAYDYETCEWTWPRLTSGGLHRVRTRFAGMRPVVTCTCPSTTTCWARETYKASLEKVA